MNILSFPSWCWKRDYRTSNNRKIQYFRKTKYHGDIFQSQYFNVRFYLQVLSCVESEGASHEVRLWEIKSPELVELTDPLKSVSKENAEICLVRIVTEIWTIIPRGAGMDQIPSRGPFQHQPLWHSVNEQSVKIVQNILKN